MKNGVCPKCGAQDVLSGAFLGQKEWNYTGNRIPVSLSFRNTAAWLDNCVCVTCGYVESYVSDPAKLEEIARLWPRASEKAP